MSKISKEGYEQIKVIKNALDSMYDKLNKTMMMPKGKVTKNVESNFESKNPFKEVQSEFEAIAGIVSMVDTWQETE